MSKIFLIIEADTNDADYIRSIETVTEKELKQIQPMIDAIKKRNSELKQNEHNFPDSEYLRGEDATERYGHVEGFELFHDMTPYGEYGIHTITSIRVIRGTEEYLL